MKAVKRAEVLQEISLGRMSNREAAQLMKLSVRQVRRLRRKLESSGVMGLCFQRVHRSTQRVADGEREEILRLRREVYRSLNLSHFRDRLREVHGITRSHEFYRTLFLQEHLVDRVQKRRKKHRKRFEALRPGILIQRDTSIHLWVPSAKEAWRLIVDLDDHSRFITAAMFSHHDDVLSNMEVSWMTIASKGTPFAYYTDNNPIYNPLNKKPKCGMYSFYRMRSKEERETISQWKRSVTELGIECIHSTPYQPQGKGKIERLFRFMQDRLVNELQLSKVSTIDEANKMLQRWVTWYNNCHLHSVTKEIPAARFKKNAAFSKLPKNISLESIFCIKHTRKVKADNTISFEGKTYQIEPNRYRISYAKANVELRINLAKKLKIYYQNQEIGVFQYKAKDIKKLPTGEDILSLE